MLKKILVGVGSVVFLFSGFNVVKAAELKKKPYLYQEGFENIDPFKCWSANAEYKVNFKGLTEEKAHSGKKSFKLDITFLGPEKKSLFAYWAIPLRVPAEGKLKFSGHILVDEESTSSGWKRSKLGVNVSCTFHSGCARFDRTWRVPSKGKWYLIEADLVKHGKQLADNLLRKYKWGMTGKDVGIYIDRVAVFLEAKAGERVVVYVDDIKVEGEVPTEEAYKEERKRRWVLVKERVERKLVYWENSLSKISKDLSSLKGEEKKKLEKKMNSLITEVSEIRKRKGYIKASEEKKISSSIEKIKEKISNLNQEEGYF